MSSSPDARVPFRSIGFSLSTTGYAVSRRFREILDPLELEPRDFALLRAVRAAEGLSQQALAERMRIPPSRMVAFIDALEARGLLERRQHPGDRRARALHLRDPGRELLGRALERAVEHERDLCGDLDDGEREQLLALLQRVALRLGLPAGVHAAHSHPALADEQPTTRGRAADGSRTSSRRLADEQPTARATRAGESHVGATRSRPGR